MSPRAVRRGAYARIRSSCLPASACFESIAAKAEVNDEITKALSSRPMHMRMVVTTASGVVTGMMSKGVIAKATARERERWGGGGGTRMRVRVSATPRTDACIQPWRSCGVKAMEGYGRLWKANAYCRRPSRRHTST